MAASRPSFVRLVITHAPDELMTTIAMSPAAVERNAFERRTETSIHRINEIEDGLRRAHARRTNGGVDCRWNLTFERSDGGKRRLSLDKFGLRAIIENEPFDIQAQHIVKRLAQFIVSS